MSGNNLPDSWEDGSSGLNINAVEFVPGQNIFATEFVPTFPTNMNNGIEPTENVGAHQVNELSAGVTGMDIDNQTVENGLSSKIDGDIPEDWADDGGGDDEETTGSEGTESEDERHKVRPPRPRIISAGDQKKEHLNVIFIGHVDAGKSTMGGQIMYRTGMVDKRTLEKYEREAKEKNRETWYLSWALDTNTEERDKGKTVEVGRAYFETEKKHFTILDAPGHRGFVPNMIGGASQADIAVLVISARKGEFETGFDRGGQTREHAMLAKTAGVRKLIVAVNKMDDATVNWEESRFTEIQDKLTPFLKKCGFNPKTDVFYLPVSGYTGANIRDTDPINCPWYKGSSLIQYMDDIPPMPRLSEGPVRLPVANRYKDMGTIIIGKVESGVIKKGQILTLMPNKSPVEIVTLFSDEDEAEEVYPGENVKIKLKNIEEDDVVPGFVLCSTDNLCHVGRVFDAQVVILEHDSIICAGYSSVMHLGTIAEEVTITHLICTIDKKSGDKSKTRPKYIKQDTIAIVRLEVQNGVICMETFKDFQPMGRFTLRDKARSVAIGKVLKVVA